MLMITSLIFARRPKMHDTFVYPVIIFLNGCCLNIFWLKSKTNEKQTNQRREKKRQIENNIYYLLVPLEVLFNLIIFAKVFSP